MGPIDYTIGIKLGRGIYWSIKGVFLETRSPTKLNLYINHDK